MDRSSKYLTLENKITRRKKVDPGTSTLSDGIFTMVHNEYPCKSRFKFVAIECGLYFDLINNFT